VSSFISTSFFSQEPWRMKNYVSSIVSSSATELRNAYMEIIGISMEAEKLYAREKKESLKKEIEKLEIQKSTMSNILADKNTVVYEYDKLETEINKLDTELGVIIQTENEKQKKFDKVEKEWDEQQNIIMSIHNNTNNLTYKINDKEVIKYKIGELKKINITELKKQISDNDKIKKEIEKLRDKWQEVNKKKNEILEDIKCNETAVNDCDKKILTGNNIIKIRLNKIVNFKNENKLLDTPCEKCGHVKNYNKIKIQENKNEIKREEKNIKCNEKELNDYKELKIEHQEYIKAKKTTLPDAELTELQETASRLKLTLLSENKIQSINNSVIEHSQIKVYEENLNKIENEILQLNNEITDLKSKKNPFIESVYNDKKTELSVLQSQIKEKQIEQSNKEGMLKEIKKQLEQIKKYETEITEILKKLDILVIDFSEWEEIEKDMYPNKLPALELEIIAGDIDFSVNQKLKGRYIIKTITQDINKKGEIIDRFEILVYNPKSGIEKSLLAHSPGQRASFFREPISQALREKRQKRENVVFNWSIADETDAAIYPQHTREYYEIMESGLSEDHTRFIMSQKSEIHNFIKNTIHIEDIAINS